MKSTLIKEPGLLILSRNEKLFASSIYVISSESAAQNLYFENRTNLIYAHKKIKEHMGGVLEVMNYLFTPYGWLMLVKTRNKEKILSYYKRRRKNKKNIKVVAEKENDSEIISEQIRYAISSIALRVNVQNNRSGTLVQGNFARFLVKDLKSAKALILKMKNKEIDLCRQSKRYRGRIEQWNEDGGIGGDGDVFLCTLNMARKERGEGGVNWAQIVDIVDFKDNVLQKIIDNSLILYGFNKHEKNEPEPPNPNYS